MSSPIRDNSATLRASNNQAASASSAAPSSSLLDSMSELRALIAKKEMELTSLAATRSSASSTSYSTTTTFAATVPRQQPVVSMSPGRLKSVAYTYEAEPISSSPLPPPAMPSYASGASLLSQSHQSQQHFQPSASSNGISAHTQSLHDQEVHEYSVRIVSLEQTLLEREEQYQTLKLEADRLKRREEALAADNEVHALAHKKQVELLNQSLESLTWNRHDSLEKQREEFERLRKEMMQELVKKEELHNLKLQNLNQNMLTYEEQLRQQQQALFDAQEKSKKDSDNAANTIANLQAEMEALKGQKASAKDQLQSGIKQQLSLTTNLKQLSRKLEETQRKQEAERADFLSLRAKLETDVARARVDAEARAEEMLQALRAVENQLLENERKYASDLAREESRREDLSLEWQQEKERLLEEKHEEKRQMVEEFTARVNASAQALTAAENHSIHLERDLQDQRQKYQHDAALQQESWNNLVQEKERELQNARREIANLHAQLGQLRDLNAQLDSDSTALRVDLAGTQSDLAHARQTLDETVNRLAETRATSKATEEERQASFNLRLDDLQNRLAKAEREGEDHSRALQVERLRTGELTAQLQLLRTSSQNKVRAIEVARQLEQQALLSDFSSQLGRVRSEISAIKSQTPKDKQREVNRQKRERERQHQATDRELSRERSAERLRSPQPQSARSIGSPGSAVGSARRHVRVRSIDDTPLHTGSQLFQ
jgi:hypothetical protein